MIVIIIQSHCTLSHCMHHSCRLFFWRLLPIISSLTLCTASTNAATNTGSSFPINPSPRLAMSRCGPAAYGGEMHTITPRHPRREVSCTFDPFRRLVLNKTLLYDAMFIRKRKRKIQTLRGGRVIVMSHSDESSDESQGRGGEEYEHTSSNSVTATFTLLSSPP